MLTHETLAVPTPARRSLPATLRRRRRHGQTIQRPLPARPPLPARRLGKRLLDMGVAAIALLLLAPLMGLIAVIIRLETPGPVIFRQKRSGRGGAPYYILKFRTMSTAARGRGRATHSFATRLQRIQVAAHDARVTRSGRWLRASSLDELPQLLNVLRGDMSLVGPRPHMPELDALFELQLPQLRRRYAVMPGMTGLAQINGRRGPTPDGAAMAARLCDDLHYIRAWSFWLDLRILAATPLRLWQANAANDRWANGSNAPLRSVIALPRAPASRYKVRAPGEPEHRADRRRRLPRRRQGVLRTGESATTQGRALVP